MRAAALNSGATHQLSPQYARTREELKAKEGDSASVIT
jgi:hypothetical protein